MNVERLEIIANWLEQGAPHKDGAGFKMATWHILKDLDFKGNECGTAMCIGGAAEQFFGDAYGKNLMDMNNADKLLGLEGDTAQDLFYPHHFAKVEGICFDDITPHHAAAVIRHLIKTGKVDWNVGYEPT